MKSYLLTGAFCMLAAFASAQITLDEVWRVDTESRDWFTTAPFDVRSAAYNPATDRVSVVNRVGTIAYVNAATGADISTATLDHGSVGFVQATSNFYVNKHAHDDNGVAYISNLSVNTSTTAFVIYRLASANDSLTTAFEGLSDSLGFNNAIRLGDTIAVTGSGVNTEIWCGTRNSGANPYPQIHLIKFTTANGLTFTPSSLITMPGFGATATPTYRGLSVKGTGSNATVWVTDSGFDAFKVNAVNGAIEDSISSVTMPIVNSATQIGYFEAYGQKFVALGPGNYATTNKGHIVKVTVPSAKVVSADTVSLRYNDYANGNATGSVTFDPTRKNIIFLTTNGSLSAHHVPAAVTAAQDWSIFE